ncbi:MAG: Bud site selection protein 20 [Heterodermia speciosa]|uniref:Bud site selection protein 20 n=1 Tax=Heterodermia speciosa TaxID=116794 RepID=A0A8H3IGL8_9LECA|nr:MAG: Bud site selection protein 20 [Heterodermia speciosa]
MAPQRVKTKRMTRGLDQIYADLRSDKHLAQYKNLKPAEDLPGLGQFYCVECAKWFEGEHSLVQHRKGKPHRRRYGLFFSVLQPDAQTFADSSRLRALKDEPYTQKEAEAATGLRTDNSSRKPSALTNLEEKAASMELETGRRP